MLDTLKAEDFEALLGTGLTLSSSAHQLPVDVSQVRRLKSPSPRAQGPFAVTFLHRGARGYAPQGIYRVALPEQGEIDLFVVPVGPDPAGMCYEAVFN